MSQQQINQWRTIGIAAFACVILLGAFVLLVLRAGEPVDLSKADRIFQALTDAVVWLILGVALKAGIQHLGQSGGVKGAWKALTTSAKPGDDQDPPAAPPPGGAT